MNTFVKSKWSHFSFQFCCIMSLRLRLMLREVDIITYVVENRGCLTLTRFKTQSAQEKDENRLWTETWPKR